MAYGLGKNVFVSRLNSFFCKLIEYSFHIKHTNNWFFIWEEKMKFLRDIFIVGLPRSGSTLVESIIGMNEEVHNFLIHSYY